MQRRTDPPGGRQSPALNDSETGCASSCSCPAASSFAGRCIPRAPPRRTRSSAQWVRVRQSARNVALDLFVDHEKGSAQESWSRAIDRASCALPRTSEPRVPARQDRKGPALFRREKKGLSANKQACLAVSRDGGLRWPGGLTLCAFRSEDVADDLLRPDDLETVVVSSDLKAYQGSEEMCTQETGPMSPHRHPVPRMSARRPTSGFYSMTTRERP